jgi:putative endonuclease
MSATPLTAKTTVSDPYEEVVEDEVKKSADGKSDSETEFKKGFLTESKEQSENENEEQSENEDEEQSENENEAWVYVLELRGGRFYVGMSKDVGHRIQRHIDGRGARATRQVPVVGIFSICKFKSRAEAFAGEKMEYNRLCALHGKRKVSMGLQFPGIPRVAPRKKTGKKKMHGSWFNHFR